MRGNSEVSEMGGRGASSGKRQEGTGQVMSLEEGVREFRDEMRKLEKTRGGFVNVPELRRNLEAKGWSREEFENISWYLRENEAIAFHRSDLTRFNPEDFLYDTSLPLFPARIGMLTWEGPEPSR